MSDPINPSAGAEPERRVKERRRGDRRRKSAKPPVQAAAPAAPEDLGGGAAFAAQVMGQDGVRRGLRGGPPVLKQARSAYLEAEWTGPADRRRRAGKTAKTDV
jgi:hypothetical protein